MLVGACKEQKDLKLREIKSTKMGMCLFKIIYFSWVVAWGYSVLKDQPYMPPSLGGAGEFSRTFDGYPFTRHCPQLKEYILIPMGYHFGSLITHFFGTRKNDFIEMGLHHIVCICLFGYCYVTNIWEIGAVIAFLHDIADMPTNLARMLGDTRYKYTSAIVFVTMMLTSWFWTRCYVLPHMIY